MPTSLPQAPISLPEDAPWAYKPLPFLGPLSASDVLAIAGAALGPLSVGGVGQYKYRPFLPLQAGGNLLEEKQNQYAQQVLQQQQAAQAMNVIGPLYEATTGQKLTGPVPLSVIPQMAPLLKARTEAMKPIVVGHTAITPTGTPLYTEPEKPIVTSPNQQIVDPVTRQPIYTTPPAPRPSIEEIRAEADAKRRSVEEEIAIRRAGVRPPSMQIKESAEGLVGIASGSTEALPITGPSGTPVQPKPEKLTEMQGKAIAFGLRAKNAVKTLDTIEASRYMGSWQRTRDQWAESVGIPRGIRVLGVEVPEAKPLRAMGFVSRVGQLYNQAKQEFITAMLRKDSGATITVSELEQAERTYFPALGDSPEVIQQKARARSQVIAGLLAEAGRGAASLQAPPLTPPASPPSGAQDTLNPTIPGVGKVLYVGEKEGLKVYQDPKTGYQFSQLPNGDWHKLKESEQFGGPP